jgi:tetratricopeptide (TPR) repeat protein
MFRRGRRHIGHAWPALRPWARSPLAPYARQELLRANRLMETGDFANAAVLYGQLARTLHDLGRLRQAGHLYLQAARARRLSGQIRPALDFYEQGLAIFAQAAMWEAFERAGSRAVEALRQQNQPQAADELAGWMQTTRPSHPPIGAAEPAEPASPRPRVARGTLPLKCPSCGATIRPDEVEWVDDLRAECDYCGSTLAAE